MVNCNNSLVPKRIVDSSQLVRKIFLNWSVECLYSQTLSELQAILIGRYAIISVITMEYNMTYVYRLVFMVYKLSSL